MAGKGHQAVNETVRAQLLASAYTAAATAVEKRTTLVGSAARRVAVETVDAARPRLRAEHAAELDGVHPWLTVAGLSAVGLLAVDLVVFGTLARRGPTWTRVLAGVSFAGHAGLFAYARARDTRIRAAAAARVKA